MQNEAGKQIALWRYQVIAPLLALDGPRGTLKREITRLSKRTHDHPLRGPIRIGYGTIEEWLHFYRRDGLDGLLPKSRIDRGRSRRIDDDLAEKIEKLALGRPDLDGPGILAELKPDAGKDLPRGWSVGSGPTPPLSTSARAARPRNGGGRHRSG